MTTSNGDTPHALPKTPAEVGEALRADARFGLRALGRDGPRLLPWLLGVMLPLAAFGLLAHALGDGRGIGPDVWLLRSAHGTRGPLLDTLAVLASHVGNQWGVVPADIALLLVLALRRHAREGFFAGSAIIGSALINVGAKHLFARTRPALWQSIAPEHSLSFPSAHAMGSMTLACVLVLLAWPTRWRWPVLAGAAGFVLAVGASRVYLGVHYPSDVLAGWLAALAWTVICRLLLFPQGAGPWRRDRVWS